MDVLHSVMDCACALFLHLTSEIANTEIQFRANHSAEKERFWYFLRSLEL